jgi:hypothetical protein
MAGVYIAEDLSVLFRRPAVQGADIREVAIPEALPEILIRHGDRQACRDMLREVAGIFWLSRRGGTPGQDGDSDQQQW